MMDAAEELSVPLSRLPLPSVLSRSGSNEEWNDLSSRSFSP
jgi:hypothetical protein